MADSYLEDITSEAEEEADYHATRRMADEEENDGRAEEEEAEQGDGVEAEEEQIPANLHGYWVKCHVKDVHVQALENEGLMAPQAESQWRTDHKALVPAPNQTEILMLKSHVERGLSMPPSHFFSNLLKFYGLQLHHIAPNSLVSIAGYAALCEGYLGIRPRVDLFQLFFSVRPNYEDDGFPRTCGTICFLPWRSKEYPFITPLDFAVGWRGSWFYMANKAAPSQTFGIRPFENIAAEKLVNDDSTTPYVQLLKGIDTINCWISWQIQPLQYHDRLMHEYTSAEDGMRCSEKHLDPKVIEKRIRSLMKSTRKEPLKFGKAMFQNGSCPPVHCFSAITHMIFVASWMLIF
jgi:hypothetical protein